MLGHKYIYPTNTLAKPYCMCCWKNEETAEIICPANPVRPPKFKKEVKNNTHDKTFKDVKGYVPFTTRLCHNLDCLKVENHWHEGEIIHLAPIYK